MCLKVIHGVEVEQRAQKHNNQKNGKPLQQLVGAGVDGPTNNLIYNYGYYDYVDKVLKAELRKTVQHSIYYIVKMHYFLRIMNFLMHNTVNSRKSALLPSAHCEFSPYIITQIRENLYNYFNFFFAVRKDVREAPAMPRKY